MRSLATRPSAVDGAAPAHIADLDVDLDLTTGGTDRATAAAPCWVAGLGYAAAIANWGIKLARFGAAIAAVGGAPASAVIEVVAGAVLASAAVVGTGAALHYCLAAS